MYGHKKPIFDNIKRQDFIIALGSIKNENTQMIFLLTIFRFGPADNNYQQISYHKINDNHYVLMYKIIITYFKYTHGFIYNIIIKHRYLQEHHLNIVLIYHLVIWGFYILHRRNCQYGFSLLSRQQSTETCQ